MFTLLLTAALIGQAKPPAVAPHPFPITTEYDRIKDRSEMRLELGMIFEDEDADLTVDLAILDTWEKAARLPLGPKDKVYFCFRSSSKTWEFLKSQELVILAGDERIRPGRPSHNGTIRVGSVGEVVVYGLTLKDLQALVKSGDPEFSLGRREFRLSPSRNEAIRDFAGRMTMSSQDAERYESEMAGARVERKHVLQAAMDDAVDQARSAVKALSKKKRAATANDVGMKKVDEVFSPTATKHKVGNAELTELLQKYPEFAGDD